ncbi:hypothetical protein VTN00DRAFT_4938 [Thermoascus crustaceus]|uniref:uncharacterized protein n=1 Tax=Thermoascus crustaceus TaxID=5088 RepID=UPI003743A71F
METILPDLLLHGEHCEITATRAGRDIYPRRLVHRREYARNVALAARTASARRLQNLYVHMAAVSRADLRRVERVGAPSRPAPEGTRREPHLTLFAQRPHGGVTARNDDSVRHVRILLALLPTAVFSAVLGALSGSPRTPPPRLAP